MHIKHGHTTGTLKGKRPSRTYRSWQAMKDRCFNPNYIRFDLYGARGVTVCDRWLKFENFLEDMGERPEGRTIDRIKGAMIYSKETCKWSTSQEQITNRKPFGKLKIKGVFKTPYGKYQAIIVKNKKQFYLGTFSCPLLASVAFENKYSELWIGVN